MNKSKFASEDGFSINSIDGFSNWDKLLHVDWIFKNTLGERIKCFVILDRDYYPATIINRVVLDLVQKNVKVHVWEKKEIENYLINQEALYRMFIDKYSKRHPDSNIPLSESEFFDKLLVIFDSLKEEVKAQIVQREVENRVDKKNNSQYTVHAQASKEFEDKWVDVEYKKKVIPGKRFFSLMNEWLNKTYNIFISIDFAIYSLKSEEIDSEIAVTIDEFTRLIGP